MRDGEGSLKNALTITSSSRLTTMRTRIGVSEDGRTDVT